MSSFSVSITDPGSDLISICAIIKRERPEIPMYKIMDSMKFFKVLYNPSYIVRCGLTFEQANGLLSRLRVAGAKASLVSYEAFNARPNF